MISMQAGLPFVPISWLKERAANPQMSPRAGNPGSQHMDAEQMAAFISGTVSAAEHVGIVLHLADCQHCRSTIAKIVHSESIVPDPDAP